MVFTFQVKSCKEGDQQQFWMQVSEGFKAKGTYKIEGCQDNWIEKNVNCSTNALRSVDLLSFLLGMSQFRFSPLNEQYCLDKVRCC